MVHRCGASGSMRAGHAAGPGSIPGPDRFPGWGFFRGFSSPVGQMSGNFRPPRFPNIIWPSLSSLLIHYGRQWPEMLTRPKKPETYINIHTCIKPLSHCVLLYLTDKLYGAETWVLPLGDKANLQVFKRKILRKIYWPIKENGKWRIRYNKKLV